MTYTIIAKHGKIIATERSELAALETARHIQGAIVAPSEQADAIIDQQQAINAIRNDAH